jgi:transposase
MGRKNSLNYFEKGQILALHGEGKSSRYISEIINRSPTVICRFIKNPFEYGIKKSSGRPQKLSKREKRYIVNTASNSSKSGVQIKNELDLNVSKWTIGRVLKNTPFIVRAKFKRTPALQPHHKLSRIEFARKHMATNWNNVRKFVYF